MSQTNIGTVAVTSGSAAIVGTSTTWLTDSVAAGDGFTVVDSGVTYDIATVTDNTHATLSANYAGTTASSLSYTIFTDFTSPDSIPELNKGDIETSTIWTRAVRKIQDLFTQFKNLAGGTVTHNFTSDGDYTLTSAQEGYGRLVLTDTTPVLTTSRNVIVSTTARGRWYKNSTAQTLTIKTSAGAGIALATTASAYLICDGTNVVEGYNLLGYGVTATATELNYTDVTNPGVAQASKALVIDSNKSITGFAIGGVPRVWSGVNALDIGNTGALVAFNSTNATSVYNNVRYDGTDYRYILDGFSSIVGLNPVDGAVRVSAAASGTAGAIATFGEKLRVAQDYVLILAGKGGSEGGELHLAAPASGTTLVGDVIVDVSGNNVRLFESGGSLRGAYIDLTAASAGVGSLLLHSNNVFHGRIQTSGTPSLRLPSGWSASLIGTGEVRITHNLNTVDMTILCSTVDTIGKIVNSTIINPNYFHLYTRDLSGTSVGCLVNFSIFLD